MFRLGTLVEVGERPSPQLGHRVVSIGKQPAGGVWVVAGTLVPHLTEADAREALAADSFQESQRISFARWIDVLEYYSGTDYEPLIRKIADRVAQYTNVEYPV